MYGGGCRGGLKIAISGEVSGIPSTNVKSTLLTSDLALIVSPAKSVGYFPGHGEILITMKTLSRGE